MRRYIVFAVVFFALGVFAADSFCSELLDTFSCGLVVLGIFFAVLFTLIQITQFKKLPKSTSKCLLLISLFCCATSFGVWRLVNFENLRQQQFRKFEGNTVRLYARVSSLPEFSKYGNVVRYTLNVFKLDCANKEFFVRGKCLISTSPEERFDYDDCITCVTSLEKPSGPSFDGGFDYAKFLKGKDIFLTGRAKFFEKIECDIRTNVIGKFGNCVKISICASINNYFDKDKSALLKGLMIGDRTQFSNEMKENFTKSGMIPIVAVSGLHVSLLFAGLEYILKTFRFTKVLTCLAAMVVLLGFTAVADYTPSVRRAVFMMIIYLFAVIVKREADAVTTLFTAAAVMLIYNPYIMFSPSFLMSFGAVLGIDIFTVPIKNTFKISRAVAASIGATIGTSFFTAYFYNVIGIASLLSNLLVCWLASFLFLGGYTVWLLSLFSSFLAKLASYILIFPLVLIIKLAEIMAKFPLNIQIASPQISQFFIYLTSCVALYCWLTNKMKKKGIN